MSFASRLKQLPLPHILRRDRHTGQHTATRRPHWLVPGLTILLLLAGGSLLRSVTARTCRQQLHEQLQTVLNLDVALLRQFFREHCTAASALAHDPRLTAILTPQRSDPQPVICPLPIPPATTSLTCAAMTAGQLNLQAQHWESAVTLATALGFSDCAVVDSAGTLVAGQHPDLHSLKAHTTTTDITAQSALQSAVARALAGEVRICPPLPQPHRADTAVSANSARHSSLNICLPVQLPDQSIVGALVVAIAPHEYFTGILQAGRGGRSGESYAFTRSGVVLTSSRFEEDLIRLGLLPETPASAAPLQLQLRDPGQNTLLQGRPRRRIADMPLTAVAAAALRGDTAVDLSGHRDYRGVPTVAAWTWLPELQIAVATQMDHAEAFQALYSLHRTVWISQLVLMVSVVLAWRRSRATTQAPALAHVQTPAASADSASTADAPLSISTTSATDTTSGDRAATAADIRTAVPAESAAMAHSTTNAAVTATDPRADSELGMASPSAASATTATTTTAAAPAAAQPVAHDPDLLGPYRLEEKLGEGGMGVVYRAQHMLMQRKAAVKLLQPDSASPAALQRFEKEVQALAQLTHASTITVLDYGRTADGTFYYAMEYLDGLNLQQLVTRYGALPEGRVIHILRQVCGSLFEAHSRGLVHRDIKPSNIMLNHRGCEPDVVKVLDFGLVRDTRRGQQQDAAPEDAWQDEAIDGTALYMSPEAIQSPAAVTARSDIYALGAVGYFLLTGHPVFLGPTLSALLQQHISAMPLPPSLCLGKPVSPELESLLMACLSKNPAGRPESARALCEQLSQIPTADAWTPEEAERWWSRIQRGLSPRVPRIGRSVTCKFEDTMLNMAEELAAEQARSAHGDAADTAE